MEWWKASKPVSAESLESLALTSLSEAPASPKKATLVKAMMLLIRAANSSWELSPTPGSLFQQQPQHGLPGDVVVDSHVDQV